MNLAGIFGAYLLRGKSALWVLPALGAIVLDGIVGVLRFKQKAEQIDIVEGIRRIRDGEVDYKLDVESLHGDNREMADAVNNIGEGIRKAVSTSMKDEQMKSDLITNVSHDIKTPLTSIINYVDLLKRLKITEEPARSYIEVLDSKSQRLKQLTDDLVEASKISSGNIVLNLEHLDVPMIRGLLVAFNGRVVTGAGAKPYLSVTLQKEEKPLELLQSILRAMQDILKD